MQVVDPSTPIDYSKSETPASYTCHKCKTNGCKLWREYNTFLDNQTLYCAICACKDQKLNVIGITDEGKIEGEYGPSDQIGWLMPAIPTQENDTFWGYTSVPQEGCNWWYGLPSLPKKT